MSAKSLVRRIAHSDLVALDSAADVWTYAPGKPVDVVRFGFTSVIAITGTGLIIKADSQLVGVARGDGDVGVITAGVAVAVGLGMYNELTAPFLLDAGESVTIQVTGAATAGDGTVWIEYIEHPFVGDVNQTAAQGNRIAGMTKKSA